MLQLYKLIIKFEEPIKFPRSTQLEWQSWNPNSILIFNPKVSSGNINVKYLVESYYCLQRSKLILHKNKNK